MKLTVEIEIKFDGGNPNLLECNLDADYIADEIQGAVSGCDGILNVASVEVKKLTLQESRGHAATHTLPGDRKDARCSRTLLSRTARSAERASTRTPKARNRKT